MEQDGTNGVQSGTDRDGKEPAGTEWRWSCETHHAAAAPFGSERGARGGASLHVRNATGGCRIETSEIAPVSSAPKIYTERRGTLPPLSADPSLPDRLTATADEDLSGGSFVIWSSVFYLGMYPIASVNPNVSTGTVRACREGETPQGVTEGDTRKGQQVTVVGRGNVNVRAVPDTRTATGPCRIETTQVEPSPASPNCSYCGKPYASAAKNAFGGPMPYHSPTMCFLANKNRPTEGATKARGTANETGDIGSVNSTPDRPPHSGCRCPQCFERIVAERDELQQEIVALKTFHVAAVAATGSVRWSLHSCPPPLGNPTREEAIDALDALRMRIESAVDVLNNVRPK